MSNASNTEPPAPGLKPCCIRCAGLFSLTMGAPDHTVTDVKGRTWIFEQHPMFGPVILRKNGNPKSRQPGSRSPFWPAWQAWHDARKANP